MRTTNEKLIGGAKAKQKQGKTVNEINRLISNRIYDDISRQQDIVHDHIYLNSKCLHCQRAMANASYRTSI